MIDMEIAEIKSVKYMVMRDDRKISDEELTLEEATKELERWRKILKKWPDGTKVRIEQIKRQYN
jgi:hypothetical protein